MSRSSQGFGDWAVGKGYRVNAKGQICFLENNLGHDAAVAAAKLAGFEIIDQGYAFGEGWLITGKEAPIVDTPVTTVVTRGRRLDLGPDYFTSVRGLMSKYSDFDPQELVGLTITMEVGCLVFKTFVIGKVEVRYGGEQRQFHLTKQGESRPYTFLYLGTEFKIHKGPEPLPVTPMGGELLEETHGPEPTAEVKVRIQYLADGETVLEEIDFEDQPVSEAGRRMATEELARAQKVINADLSDLIADLVKTPDFVLTHVIGVLSTELTTRQIGRKVDAYLAKRNN